MVTMIRWELNAVKVGPLLATLTRNVGALGTMLIPVATASLVVTVDRLPPVWTRRDAEDSWVSAYARR